jgi:hypothetical protein
MENIDIHILKRRSLPGEAPLRNETPFDRRSGFFGMVIDIQPNNNTVDIRSDSGRIFTGIRVASPQWVTIPTKDMKTKNKEKLTGKRHLPPVNTYVYCLMPTGEPSSAIVLCSVFAYQDPSHADFKEDSDDATFIEKEIDSGGWMFTHDTRTGTRKIRNSPKDGDETISMEINQEEEGNEKVVITIHKNVFTVDKENGIKIETDKNINKKADKDSTETVGGNKEEKIDGKYNSESGDTNIKSTVPVGINDGLYVTGLKPYLEAEANAHTSLQSAAQAAQIPACVLDVVSGGTGAIAGFFSAVIAFCSALKAADTAAHTSIAKAVK